MSDARQALDAARSAKVDQLLPSTYNETEEYLNNASRMLLFGQYEYSREQALKATAQAQVSRELALRLQRAKHVIESIENRDEYWYEAHDLVLIAHKAAAEGWLNEADQILRYALRDYPDEVVEAPSEQ